jgi:hypothetical protein
VLIPICGRGTTGVDVAIRQFRQSSESLLYALFQFTFALQELVEPSNWFDVDFPVADC